MDPTSRVTMAVMICALIRKCIRRERHRPDIRPGHGYPPHNTAPDQIANFEETANCQGHGITASVAADGKFTMTNLRNGFSKS
jgi:hypothetical protein